MTPSVLHVPPLGTGAGASVCGRPPEMSTRFSFPPAKNPRERLSGDQNGTASSVSVKARAVSVPRSRRCKSVRPA